MGKYLWKLRQGWDRGRLIDIVFPDKRFEKQNVPGTWKTVDKRPERRIIKKYPLSVRVFLDISQV